MFLLKKCQILPPGGACRDRDKRGALLIAHGALTARGNRALDNIERRIHEEFNDISLYRAYTSSSIGRKNQAESIQAVLERMRQHGIERVTALSLHLAKGFEYAKIPAAIRKFSGVFKKIDVGGPLLNSAGDIEIFVNILLETLPPERNESDAVVLMAHGSWRGQPWLDRLADNLARRDKLIFAGALNGSPSLEAIRQRLKQSKVKKAYLAPLTITAGNHVLNDLAGAGPSSWKTLIEADGTNCVPIIRGLGENDRIAAMFVNHLRQILTTAEGAHV